MFSAILATVLASSGGAYEQFCHRGSGYAGGGSCYTGHGGWAWNGGHNGCWGYGCSGCHGCYGGYHATSCHNNYGSAYGPGGYWGGYSSGPPFVGSGFGSCGYNYYGGSPNGAYAPYGWHTGWRNYMDVGCFGCHGCYGTYTGWGCAHAGAVVVPGEAHAYPAPKPLPPPAAPVEPQKKPDGPGGAGEAKNSTNLKSLVVVDVPEDAKIFIDGNAMKPGSGRRTFSTPALSPNKTYYYDVTLEVVRDGKPVRQTQRLVIRPGQEVVANFSEMNPTPAVTQVSNPAPAGGQ